MKKKLMAMLLCVAMLLTLAPTMAFAATETELWSKDYTFEGKSFTITCKYQGEVDEDDLGTIQEVFYKNCKLYFTAKTNGYGGNEKGNWRFDGLANGGELTANKSYNYQERGNSTYKNVTGDPSTTVSGWAEEFGKDGFMMIPATDCGFKTATATTLIPVKPVIASAFTGWTYCGTPATEELKSGNPGNGEVTYTYYYDEDCHNNHKTNMIYGGVSLGAQPVNAGDYWVKATVAASGNFAGGTSEAVAFTIAKAEVTITADNKTIEVGETTELTATVEGKPENSAAAAVNYSLVVKNGDVVVSALEELPEGEYDIVVVVVPGSNPNYTVTPVNGTLTVEEVVYSGMSAYAVDCGTGVTANRKTTFAGNTVTLTVAEGYENPVVTDASGKAVNVTAGKNGKFTFQMPASAVTVSVSKAAEVVVDDAVCTDCADVDVEAWYHDGIHYCLENGLMKGVSDDTFAPSATTNRAMMWTILARVGGEEVDATGAQWYLPGQEWAVANGISDGTNMTADITREQFATMLYRYAQSKGQGFTGSWMFQLDFTDASSISDWANEAMHWCAMKGILNGKGANNLDPQGALTRAEAAAMIQRYCQLDK